MTKKYHYLLVLPVLQMNQVKQISDYKFISCADVIRDAIQQRVIEFEKNEKPIFDQIKYQKEENNYPDDFFHSY